MKTEKNLKKLNFLDGLSVHSMEVLDQDDKQINKNGIISNQKLVIMNIYNSYSDQHSLYTMNLVHKKSNGKPSWEFV